MNWDDLSPLLSVAALAGFALALKAALSVRAMRVQLASLQDRFWRLEDRVARLGALPTADAGGEAREAEPVLPEPQRAAVLPSPEPADGTAASPTAPAAPSSPDWERLLVENWLVWLGGAAIALGGAFLVKLSIDYGLLTPPVRVALGCLLGIALSLGSEWVLRREAAQEGPSYVPPALAASGAATLFASVYAAYALYGLLPGAAAFVLLAAVAAATVAQSLRHGPFVAALGLVGAYVVPMLVASDSPQALPLYAYLTVVTAGALALLRHRSWWWLAWLSLAGATLWVPLWLGGAAKPETPVVALYLLVQFGLFVLFRRGIARIGFLAGIADAPLVRIVTRAAFWAIAFALLLVAHADGFGDTSVAAAAVMVIALLAFAYRDPALDDASAAAGALAVALLATWTLPRPVPEMNYWVFPVAPDHVARFATAAIGFAVLLGAGVFAMLPRVARAGRWAALSAAAPLLILTVAHWRLQKFHVDVAWTLAALALAGAELYAAASVAKRRDGNAEHETALAAYAVGVLGSTGLAAAFGIGDAGLTVALALHLPAMGWIDGRIRIKGMRWAALAVAGVVLVRLVLNPYVLEYPLSPTPIFNWLLYGYGVPALAFIVATRQFGGVKDDWLVWALEAGSALFTFLLLTLEVDHALYGRLAEPLDDFSNGAVLISLWLAFAAGLLWLGDRRRRPVLLWGGWLLLAGATVIAVGWEGINLLLGVSVGNLLVFDALLFAAGIPAALYAAIAWLCPQRPVLRTVCGVLAAAFAFAWITLEIQHAFHAQVEFFHSSGEAEWYAYSLAWLGFTTAALAFGLVRRSEWLRRAGLIGIGLVIGKVFLSDMAELTGVLRALSFIGLGGALVGLGYAYRRLRPVEQP